MTLTVAQVLELDVLRRADAVLLAGEAGLGRPVRWVHVGELPDMGHLLKGGELLLTTGMGIGDRPEQQRRFVRELVRAGCAGLVIELLRSFRRAPRAVVEEADRLGLPLVGLGREARFVEITEQVHSAIINGQYALLVKADAIAREFTGLALGGGRLKPILTRLAVVVSNPVVLEDGAHQVIECAPLGGDVGELLEAWERHSRAGHASRGDGVQIVEGNPGCAWTQLTLRGERWGRLHVIAQRRALDEIDRLALDRAAAAVAIALLSERELDSAADHARSALIADAAGGELATRDEFLRRARALGSDLGARRLGAIALRGAPTDDQELTEPCPVVRRRFERAALRLAREAICERRWPAVVAAHGGCVFVVAGLSDPGRSDCELARMAEEICARCQAGSPGLRPAAGVSAERVPGSVSMLLEQADEALACAVDRGGGVQRYSDLGVHHLLLRLREGPELAGFVEGELAPLLTHDAGGRPPLLPTLRVYLACDRNKSRAARELFVERRTLHRRLRRISELLDAREEDHERWLRIELAVHGLDVLRERAPAS